ncbi:MAG: HD domain-containing protein [Candidatus Portnoybacteria bacterium]
MKDLFIKEDIVLEKVTALLATSGGRDGFFLRIASFLPSSDYRYQAIKKAYDVAEEAFYDIKRLNGDRYFEHLRAVALILIVYLRVKDYCLIVVALLHDIVEDIPGWTIERARIEFGNEVANLLEYMTKPAREFPNKEERNKAYFERFHNAPREFFLIKLADRLHNLITLWVKNKKEMIRKIEETKRYYLPFAEHHLILLYELEEALENLEKKSIQKKGASD